MDTPDIKGNPNLCGEIVKQLIDGAWYATDWFTGEILSEKQRTKMILK